MKKIKMSIDQIKEDMVIGQDIFGEYDRLLIARGTTLIDIHIKKMKEMNMEYIYILQEQKKEKYQLNIEEEKKLNEKYEEALSAFKQVYEEVALGEKIEIELIKNTATPLVENVILHNDILGRLRGMDVNDDYTYTHSINVCIISTMIGKWLEYDKEKLNKLAMAAILHDIGKIKVNADILNKPARLTEEEFEEIKEHSKLGYEIVKNNDAINIDVRCGILQHHEKMDGTGYPRGLKGEKIHEFARIIAIADIFDAMTSKRVYKLNESPFKVADEIEKNAFGKLDPYITNIFLRNIYKFYVGNVVRLNTGEVGVIVLIHLQRPTRPLIKVGNRFIDLLTSSNYEIEEVLS